MNTEIKPAPLYVTFVGGLIKGFHAIAIDVKSETEHLFYKNEARRVHTQYAELQNPAEVLKEYDEDRGGNIVVFIGGMRGGELFGPFGDDNLAKGFAARLVDERGMREGSYELFTVEDSHTKRG